MLHLNALDQDMVLILLVIVEEETTVKHDRVVFLSDLVGLGKVSVHIVFPVELDLGEDAPAESQRSLDGLIQALFVQDGEHTWQTQINKVGMSVGFLIRGVQRSYIIDQNKSGILVYRFEIE